jgi:predicted ATPase
MKLRTLDVENLLSFDQFHLNFDDHLTVLVGPNGSGKSNVVRMLDLVRTKSAGPEARWLRPRSKTSLNTRKRGTGAPKGPPRLGCASGSS